jgi:hypothetical protein
VANFDDVLKKASPPTRALPLCLAGEVLEEIDELEQRLERTPAPTSLGDSTRREIAEAILAAQERMHESTVVFHLRAMPVRGEGGWTAFMIRQPERAQNESRETYQARLFPWYAELVSRTVVDPAMSVQQVEELADHLHGGAWNQLAAACMELNGGKLDVPNSEAASAMTRDSEPT